MMIMMANQSVNIETQYLRDTPLFLKNLTVKVKVFRVISEAPRNKGMMGRGGFRYNCRHS
jgi:hypothetical protein